MKRHKADSGALPRRRNISCLKALLIILTVIYPFFMNITAGIGMCLNGGKSYGIALFISSGLIFAAVALCLCGLNILPAVLCFSGTALCVAVIYRYTLIMTELGRTDYDLVPLYEKYPMRHYPTAFVFVILAIIAMIRFFSFDEADKRRSKRALRDAEKNAEAPHILQDD